MGLTGLRAAANRRLASAIQSASYAIHNFRDAYDAFTPLRRQKPVRTPSGILLLGGPSQHHQLMQRGDFEVAEMPAFAGALDDCSVFIDVGANIGFYTCIARAAGKHVIAIEPQHQNLKYLYANLHLNGWTDIEVFPMGLSNAPGVGTLYGVSSTGASLIRGWAGATDRYRSPIALSTLDVIVGDRFAGKRILIKIDVEGAEREVLMGANRVLDSLPRPAWFMEITLDEFREGGNPHYEGIFDSFFQRGYSCKIADATGAPVTREDVRRWAALRRTDTGAFNYLFL